MANMQLAQKLGIAEKIPITSAIRQPGCDAQYAELAGVQGKHALYVGECACRHRYEIKVLIKKAQSMHQLSIGRDGGLSIGAGKGHKIGELDEY